MADSKTAFVLGGGGHLGGYEVGMLRALLEADVHPDLIIGTSIGSIQGAMFAKNPTAGAIFDMQKMWAEFATTKLLHTGALHAAATVLHDHTHYASNAGLVKLITEFLGADTTFEQLRVPFQCVGASIERAAARYFDSGPLLPALLASAAVPGLWPSVEIDGEHYMDGGVVDSIPVDRALELGANPIYVLHVGRIERPLHPPRAPWEVAAVAFEIGRRHGFMDTMSRVPADVTVHVMPSGEDPNAPHHSDHFESGAKQLADIQKTIDSGYRASQAYLAAHLGG